MATKKKSKKEEESKARPEHEEVSLTTIAGGAAGEMFSEELEKVVANIIDPNTDPAKVREIKLTVKIKPNPDGNIGAVKVEASSKLASIRPVDTVIYMAKIKGKCIAVESNPKQMDLLTPDEPTTFPTVPGGQGGEEDK
jgi:hypothetical protein